MSLVQAIAGEELVLRQWHSFIDIIILDGLCPYGMTALTTIRADLSVPKSRSIQRHSANQFWCQWSVEPGIGWSKIRRSANEANLECEHERGRRRQGVEVDDSVQANRSQPHGDHHALHIYDHSQGGVPP